MQFGEILVYIYCHSGLQISHNSTWLVYELNMLSSSTYTWTPETVISRLWEGLPAIHFDFSQLPETLALRECELQLLKLLHNFSFFSTCNRWNAVHGKGI